MVEFRLYVVVEWPYTPAPGDLPSGQVLAMVELRGTVGHTRGLLFGHGPTPAVEKFALAHQPTPDAVRRQAARLYSQDAAPEADALLDSTVTRDDHDEPLRAYLLSDVLEALKADQATAPRQRYATAEALLTAVSTNWDTRQGRLLVVPYSY